MEARIQMNSRKIFIPALVLALLLSSCGQAAVTDGKDTTTDSTSAETTAPEPEYEYADIDLGGGTFTILNTSQTYNFYSYLDFDEATGETLNDAIFNRNRKAEDLYNFNLEIVEHELKEANTKFGQAVLAGDASYDAAFLRDYYLNTELTEGYLMNLDTIPEFRLDKEWWDGEVTEESRIGKSRKALFAMTDVSLCDFEETMVTFINENIMTDLGLENPYELVRSGKWTFDKLCEFMHAGASLNGDESFTLKQDGNARYGAASYERGSAALISGAGIDSAYIDDSGRPQIGYTGEKFYTYFEKIKAAFSVAGDYIHANTGTVNDYGHYENLFKSGRALMTLAQLKAANNYRDMADAYGILPIPKYDEIQKDYHCLRTFTYLMVVPVTNNRPHETGSIMDTLSYITYKDIMPSFYAERVSQKLLRGDDSIEMLGIVRSSRRFDVGSVYNIFLPLADEVVYRSLSSNKEIASTMATKVKTVEANIDKIMAAMDK